MSPPRCPRHEANPAEISIQIGKVRSSHPLPIGSLCRLRLIVVVAKTENCPGCSDGPGVRGNVKGDQGDRRDRPTGVCLTPEVRPGGPNALGSFPHAIRAVEADRRFAHVVRADMAFAPNALDVALALRMAAAKGRGPGDCPGWLSLSSSIAGASVAPGRAERAQVAWFAGHGLTYR